MTERLIYSRPDGSMCVVTPAPASRRPEESKAVWLQRVFEHSVPLVLTSSIAGTSYQAGMEIDRRTAKKLQAEGHAFTFSAPPSAWSDEAAIAALDRDFRPAWQFTPADGAGVNMVKARQLHFQRIRLARDARFPHLDAEFAKYDGQAQYGDDIGAKAAAVLQAKQVEARRQQLRNAPQSVETQIAAAATTAALKAIWPAALQS